MKAQNETEDPQQTIGSVLLIGMGKEVREWCERKGWRKPGDRNLPDAFGRTFGDECALLHSEVSEALEAFRDHGVEDATVHHRPEEERCSMDGTCTRHKPEGVASELADLFIRLLDTCEHLDIDLYAEYERKMAYNETRTHRHGGRNL